MIVAVSTAPPVIASGNVGLADGRQLRGQGAEAGGLIRGRRRTASRKVTPEITVAWRAVQPATHGGSRLEISRRTQPFAFRMKNSFSASIKAAYRSNRSRAGWPARTPGSKARSAERRTQKSSSVAQASTRGHDDGSRSAMRPGMPTRSA
jgi:hypothetical protein